jgi:hypothetical protein
MHHTKSLNQISYISWILGQTSAMLGVILMLVYGFDLVILQAQQIYAENLGELAATSDAWVPPLGPPILGLGLALLGWMAAHLRDLTCPAPVLVGAILNLSALALAFLALGY